MDPALASASTAIPSRRRRRRLRRSVVVTVVFGTLAVLPPVLAAAQYVAWRADDGIHGCVAKVHELFVESIDIDACIADRAEALIDEHGIARGMDIVERAAGRDPVLMSRCHVPFHELGRRARRAGVPVSGLRAAGADDRLVSACVKGFVHGYIQQLGGEPGITPDDMLDASSVLCDGMRGEERLVCVHGVGHAVARAARNDLERAGAACGQLAAQERHHCVRGAVMELQMAAPVHAERLEPDAGMAPTRPVRCEAMPPTQRTSCTDQVRSFAVLGTLFRAGLA